VRPSISADGRFVAFQTEAAFDPEDRNGKTDVYVHDLQTGATDRVSTAPGGADGNGGSYSPSLSGDGRFVAFWSNASNLVEDDTNRVADVFVADRVSGRSERVSVPSRNTSDARTSGEESNGLSSDPSISRDGRYVAFWSEATNLVRDDTNGKRDVFAVDRAAGTTTRVSVADDGTQGNGDSYSPAVALLADGHLLVAFDSVATNLGHGPEGGPKRSHVFIHLNDDERAGAGR
jgi:Tol biopolymer transport system component